MPQNALLERLNMSLERFAYDVTGNPLLGPLSPSDLEEHDGLGVVLETETESGTGSILSAETGTDGASNQSYLDALESMCLETYKQVSERDVPSPRLFQFIVYGILLTTIGLLGIAGNLISVTILSRPKMRSSINCCLIGLTTFDLIVTSTSILMFGLPEISESTEALTWYANGLYQRVMPFVYPLGLIAQTGSIYLTVTVTLERYVAVCRPLQARSLCTHGRARIYVLAVAFFSVIYNLPRFWEVSYKECNSVDMEDLVIVVPSALRQDPYYIEVYIMWMYLLIMYLIPFLCLMIFNFFIYREVRAANHERQRLSRLQKKEIGLAVMLLVVVSVFFLCNALAFVINVLEMSAITIDELTITSNLLVTINSSVNFIIYCIFGQKFRKVFLKIFCSRILPSSVARDDPNYSAYGDPSRVLANGRGGGGACSSGTENIHLNSLSGQRLNPVMMGAHNIPRSSYNPTTRILRREKQFY